MNVQISSTRTAAEKLLIDRFEKVSAALPGNDQSWLKDVRRHAIQAFEKAGLPHRRLERWKYTDLRNLLREMPEVVANNQAAVLMEGTQINAHTAFANVDRYLGVFVNGYYRPELSSLENIEGLEVVTLGQNADALPGWAHELIEANQEFDDNAVLALNVAFAGEGAMLRVKAGVKIDKPVHLAFVVTEENVGSYNFRNLIKVEAGAELTVVETYVGPQDVAYVVNSSVQLSIADDAVLTRIKVQDEGLSAIHLANTNTLAGENARCHDMALVLGAAVSRNEGYVDFTGEHSDVTISGASMLAGKQHGDTTLRITHSLPNSDSRQQFKTVLDDNARGIFQGGVVVKPDAQHTDGRQMTQALLLSLDAEMDARPELEIYADDVECAHGATIGDLDENYLFYLRARGIPEAEAKALLVAAFVAEPIDALEHGEIRESLHALTTVWFDRRKKRAENV